MGRNLTIIKVNILDKEYQISCPEDEVDSLRESAAYLSTKMTEIRDSGNVLGLDRIAVISALNIASELVHEKEQAKALEIESFNSITELSKTIEEAIANNRQLDL
tara:strand:+ start:1129 stop:1443 length:315 start_codon:yes stop_codon:yes gene_type:complete